MEREIYVRNSEWIVSRITDADRSDYVELHRQINGDNSLFLNPICKDQMWESVLKSKNKQTFSVFDKNMVYCGSVEIQDCNSVTPELGIDLLKGMRNRGICSQVIPMISRRYYEENEVEYYWIRILSTNSHSIHVFEKLGAEFVREGLNPEVTFIQDLRKVMEAEEPSHIIEKLKKILDYQVDEVVYEYKWLPECFLPG